MLEAEGKIYDYCVSVLLCLRQYPPHGVPLPSPPNTRASLASTEAILVTFKFLFPLCHGDVKTYFR